MKSELKELADFNTSYIKNYQTQLTTQSILDKSQKANDVLSDLIEFSKVTPEILKLQEGMITVSKEYKKIVESKFKVGLAPHRDIINAEYLVLNSQIKFLQAKELLELKQQTINFLKSNEEKI